MSQYLLKVESPQHGIDYLDAVSGLTIRQAYPGGFQSCSFALPGWRRFAEFSRLTITKGPIVIFDGQIRGHGFQGGAGGSTTKIEAYGHSILLTDDAFGPRVYADTRLGEWHTPDPAIGYQTGTIPELGAADKFTLSTNGDRLRIAAKPGAIFNGQARGGFVGNTTLGHDMAGYQYKLPLSVAALPYGTLAQVVVDWACQFPAGSWELCAISSDEAGFTVHSIATATGSGTATITPMANATTIMLVLRAKADQAVYGGRVEDGQGSTILSTLEYAGKWEGHLNVTQRAAHSGEGAMMSQDAATAVTTARDGSAFYPTATTLSATITSGATSLTVTSSSGFPGSGSFTILIDSEQMTVTAGAGTTTWTVTRGVNGTSAAAHNGGVPVFYYQSRTGGAARLRFTGRSIALYAEKWGSQGDIEYQIWDKAGASVTGPTTVSENNSGHLTGTVSATSGSATVTGSGTAFLTELAVGDIVIVPIDASGAANGDLRRVTNIATNTSLTIDAVATTTVSGVQMSSRRFQTPIFSYTLPAFGTYTLTLRNLGTVGGAGSSYYIKVDYFSVGVAGMAPFEDNDLYAEVGPITVRTTTATLDAARVARDTIAFYGAAAIGLSTSILRVNEAGAALPALDHLTYDDPTTGADALDDICAIGSQAGLPLAWAVWDNKLLTLEEWDVEGRRGRYEIDPADCQIEHESTIQEDFANVVARVSRDGLGQRVIGPDSVSDRIVTEHGGRRRRVVLDAKQTDDDAAWNAATYIGNHDRPSIRTRVTTSRPVRDQGGAIIPPDEVRAGRLLRIGGYDELGILGAADRRGGRQALIVAVEWDHENQTLTLELGEGRVDRDRLLAALKRTIDRQKAAS